jgi:hypothetical protein
VEGEFKNIRGGGVMNFRQVLRRLLGVGKEITGNLI